MAWSDFELPWEVTRSTSNEGGSIERVGSCFIRKDHRCDKMLGASKSCFIACPNDTQLKPLLDLISEKLARSGVEAYVAVQERSYGQDIFCTKICGKIIESLFCVVILDDSPNKEGVSIPNPNVYYEYGLMTALNKHIVPLHKAGQTLAFNIQSFDSIQYLPETMSAELDSAIRDAIRGDSKPEAAASEGERALPQRSLLRRLEFAGMKQVRWDDDEDGWFPEAVGDTAFRGFYRIGNGSETPYLCLANVESDAEIPLLLEDLAVIEHRVLRQRMSLETKIASRERMVSQLKDQVDSPSTKNEEVVRMLGRRLRESQIDLESLQQQLAGTDVIHVGFYVHPDMDVDSVRATMESAVAPDGPVDIIFPDDEGILRVAGKEIDLGMHVS